MSRRRYRWDAERNCLVEVGVDYTGQRRNEGLKSEEEVYGHIAATDGTDLSTRKRHREYMKEKGLCLSDDFKGEWDRREVEMKKAVTPGSGFDSKERREQMGRIHYELKSRARRR